METNYEEQYVEQELAILSLKEGKHFFKNSHLGSAVLKRMYEKRLRGEFCDITISTGGTLIMAHKIVLASLSDYFERLFFNREIQDINLNSTIDLENLDTASVVQLVDFAYTGSIIIAYDNVEALIEAADYLAVESVCQGCCDFLIKCLKPDNCIQILKCAQKFCCHDLENLAFDMILKHFKAFSETDELNTLPYNTIKKIIGSDKLVVHVDDMVLKPPKQEVCVLKFILKYIRKNNSIECPEAVGLIKQLRIPLIDSTDLKELEREIFFSSNSELKDLLKEAKSVQRQTVLDNASPSWCRPRKFAGFHTFLSENIGCGPFLTETSFNDETLASNSFVNGLKVWTRIWNDTLVLAGLKVFYANGQTSVHGETNCPKVNEFHLNPGEWIEKVELKSGWLIDRLLFKTNHHRTFGPFGGSGGIKQVISATKNNGPSYLAYICGDVAYDRGAKIICNLKFAVNFYSYAG